MPEPSLKKQIGKKGIAIRPALVKIMGLLGVIYLFLLSLRLMGESFLLFGVDFSEGLLTLTANPIVALFIGLLATAVIQSSSTTTTAIVSMIGVQVAIILKNPDLSHPEATEMAAGVIKGAVPMILGANIGTSVTSTIIALGHIGRKKEYSKAISAATAHDFFNILTVLILAPLEYFFGILSNTSIWLAESFASQPLYSPVTDFDSSGGTFSILIMPVVRGIMRLTALPGNFPPGHAFYKGIPWITLPLAILGVFFSLRWLSKLLKSLLIGRVQRRMDQLFFEKPMVALSLGLGLTALFQSSSVTTSLLVPLVATNRISLKKAFPFLIGANIGTTSTALVAGIVSGAPAAMAVAFCHVLFNLVGALVIFPFPLVRSVPVWLARQLGNLTLKNRLVGIFYVVTVFFLLPVSLLFFTGDLMDGPPKLKKQAKEGILKSRKQRVRENIFSFGSDNSDLKKGRKNPE